MACASRICWPIWGCARGAGDDYRTRAEWRDAWGVSERRVMMILQAAKHEGKIKTTRVQREALDGALRWVPAYKFVLG
jgi:hypothetical protein